MFSRLVSSARSFINPPPQKTIFPKTLFHTPTKAMVTTRSKEEEDPVEEEEMTEENSINVYVPVSSSKRKAKKISRDEYGQDGEDATESPSPKKRKILPVRVKDEEPIITNTRPVVLIPAMKATPQPDSELGSETERPRSAKKHKKFGSEEPEEHLFSTAPEQPESLSLDTEDEEVAAESSEDDAPEEVGAQDAAKDAKLQAQSAAEAIKGFRKKRKERSSKIKTTPKKSSSTLREEEDNDKTAEIEAPEVQSLSANPEETDLLPGVSLDSSDEDEVLPIVSKSHKTKFEHLSDKAPKDHRVGSTTYRVTKVQSKNLAPKFDHNAKLTKEAWLQGRSGKGIGANRRPMRQGFFKK